MYSPTTEQVIARERSYGRNSLPPGLGSDDQHGRALTINQVALNLSATFDACAPNSPQLEKAHQKLFEAVIWARQAILSNE